MTTFRSVALRGAATVLLLAASGCADDIAAPAAPEANLTSAAGSQQQSVQTITYAIARSLEDPRLRQRLLEDLRDSPNPQHKLHLKSYLQGAEGGALLAAGARRLKKPQHELLALLQSMPEMELVVPRRFDRIIWTGSADLVVFGLSRSLHETGREGGRLTGYTPTGDSVSISVFDEPPYVMLMLRPQEGSFGSDPEARRTAVPNRNRNTISKREVEFSLDPTIPDPECTGPGCSIQTSPGDVTITCLDDPSTLEIECEPAGPQPVPFGGIDLGFSANYCTSPTGDDADQDGVRDGCEEVIAQTFAPVLRIDERDRCPTREPYWSVAPRPESPRSLKVMYLLSYHVDCPNSALIWGNTGHRGDSEWIVITVVTASSAPTQWYTYSITTSAHFGEASDATKTTTYEPGSCTSGLVGA